MFLDYELLQDKAECSGADETVGELPTLDECASACKTKTSLFVYGRQGTERCSGGKCRCKCVTDSLDGECTGNRKEEPKYALFKYKKGKREFITSQ